MEWGRSYSSIWSNRAGRGRATGPVAKGRLHFQSLLYQPFQTHCKNVTGSILLLPSPESWGNRCVLPYSTLDPAFTLLYPLSDVFDSWFILFVYFRLLRFFFFQFYLIFIVETCVVSCSPGLS